MTSLRITTVLSPLLLAVASCGGTSTGDRAEAQPREDAAAQPFALHEAARFDRPWAMAFAPGTSVLFVTEKAGTLRFLDTASGRLGTVTGVPAVDYGGQGGLGDIAFLSSEASPKLDRRTLLLTWVEAGPDDTRGAVAGRGTLVCAAADSCRIEGLTVIWRQAPKVTGRGHYSHRLAVSPDSKFLYIASGDRQKMDPAQDPASDLGKIIRLPLADPAKATRISWGHRNILGMAFDGQDRLWEIEHGPAGGDELNLVKQGGNYGWPLVSEGKHYDGRTIAPHSSRNDVVAPAISWNPVIAPGGMIIYSGNRFPEWRGQVLIGAMKPAALVRVGVERGTGLELARYSMERRIRAITQGPDGSVWLAEDGPDARLLRLEPRRAQ